MDRNHKIWLTFVRRHVADGTGWTEKQFAGFFEERNASRFQESELWWRARAARLAAHEAGRW